MLPVAPNNLGDWASLAGVVVGVVGFALTLVNVTRSRRAAEAAEESAKRVRAELRRSDAIAEFASAISQINEIKRLQRSGSWDGVPDRLTAIRHALIAVRSANPSLSDEQQAILTGALTHLREMERSIEQHLSTQADAPNVAKANDILSEQADGLAAILSTMRATQGGQNDG